MPPKILHHAFSTDFQSRKFEIVTPCEVKNSYAASDSIFRGNALWDTGATHSVIGLQTVEPLGLIPIAQQAIIGVHGEQEAWIYVVDILLPNNVVYQNCEVAGAAIGGHDLLVGMDIIGMGDFSVCGGRFVSYCAPPFEKPVNFVERAERANERIARGDSTG